MLGRSEQRMNNEYYELPEDMSELLNLKDELVKNGLTEREMTFFVLIESLFKQLWDIQDKMESKE
jgi:hypothetical protein